jgi:spermidine synthase
MAQEQEKYAFIFNLYNGENIMELWYTEKHTDNVLFTVKVKEFLHSAKSPYQKLDFFDTYEFGRIFTLDGFVMVTEKDEFIYHDMIVHVPMAVKPNAKKVLCVGGGDGGTVRELCRYKTLEQIDMVEIDEMVVEACKKYFPKTSCSFDDPRVHLYFQDGVAFVKNTKEKYDIILVDSTDPIGPGEGLFSMDFYKDCFNCLTDDGILVNQHESPYYPACTLSMQKAHTKIKRIFPVHKVYQFHMPTYPSGHWLFGFASKGLDPIKDVKFEEWKKHELETKYYNPELHIGCFALPTYVQELLQHDIPM